MSLAAAHAAAFTMSDITHWIGDGDHSAALVIDWADGSTPLVWGFHWSDGDATSADDLFNAVLTGDTRLHAYFDGPDGYGALYGLGYDDDNDGFARVTGPSDTGHAGDADDRYAEGWFNAGYWGQYVNIDNNEFNYGPAPDYAVTPNPNFGTLLGEPYNGGTWGYSGQGLADTQLFDGLWLGLAFAPNFAADFPASPAPEPAGLALLSLGALALVRRR